MSELETPTPLLDDVRQLIYNEQQAERLTVPQYVSTLDGRYRVRWWAAILEGLAEVVEPVDSVLGKDPAKPSAQSFLRGGILGMRVVEQARGIDFLGQVIGAVMNSAEDFDPYGNDEDVEEHVRQTATAEIILDLGGQGQASEDPNLEIVNRWEDLLTPQVPLQRFTGAGFGFILHVSHELIRIEAEMRHNADMEKFAQEVAAASHSDWSAALGELL